MALITIRHEDGSSEIVHTSIFDQLRRPVYGGPHAADRAGWGEVWGRVDAENEPPQNGENACEIKQKVLW